MINWLIFLRCTSNFFVHVFLLRSFSSFNFIFFSFCSSFVNRTSVYNSCIRVTRERIYFKLKIYSSTSVPSPSSIHPLFALCTCEYFFSSWQEKWKEERLIRDIEEWKFLLVFNRREYRMRFILQFKRNGLERILILMDKRGCLAFVFV